MRQLSACLSISSLICTFTNLFRDQLIRFNCNLVLVQHLTIPQVWEVYVECHKHKFGEAPAQQPDFTQDAVTGDAVAESVSEAAAAAVSVKLHSPKVRSLRI